MASRQIGTSAAESPATVATETPTVEVLRPPGWFQRAWLGGRTERDTDWNDPLRRRMLAAADLLAALGAIVVVGALGNGGLGELLCAAAVAPVWVVVAKAYALYDTDHAHIGHLTVDELPRLFQAATLSAALIALLFSAVPSAALGPHVAI